MIKLLPSPNTEVWRFHTQLFHRVKEFLRSKQRKYRLATIVDLILIAAILINGRQPAQSLISPIVSSLQSYYSQTSHRTTKENFAFVPNLARNKFSRIDLSGLTYLSFFDVPLSENGEINFNSRGYASLISGEAQELFDRARYQNTKIFLTLSAFDKNIIKNILDNIDAQHKLAQQAADEISNLNIDGITVDFESPFKEGNIYQEKLTKFITLLTDHIHSVRPFATVAVAVPSMLTHNQSLYNIEALSKVSDKLFLVASDFIVPEFKNSIPQNPVYGFEESEYFAKVSNLLSSLQRITPDKLVMERAWYGNGNQYPLYTPSDQPPTESRKEPSDVIVDTESVESLVAGVPAKGKAAARENIPLIAEALDREGILDSNVLAYALATVEHETDETFQPIPEIQGAINARRYGYEGGANYFGRGFIQITHLRNYKKFGERIGMGDQLVKNPHLASDPQIAARILAAFFKDNNVANLASQGKFVAARTPVNPDYNGYSVARLAAKYDTY